MGPCFTGSSWLQGWEQMTEGWGWAREVNDDSFPGTQARDGLQCGPDRRPWKEWWVLRWVRLEDGAHRICRQLRYWGWEKGGTGVTPSCCGLSWARGRRRYLGVGGSPRSACWGRCLSGWICWGLFPGEAFTSPPSATVKYKYSPFFKSSWEDTWLFGKISVITWFH